MCCWLKCFKIHEITSRLPLFTVMCTESINSIFLNFFKNIFSLITDWLTGRLKDLEISASLCERLWYVQHVAINVWHQFNCKFLFPAGTLYIFCSASLSLPASSTEANLLLNIISSPLFHTASICRVIWELQRSDLQDKSELWREKGSGWCSALEFPLARHCRGQSGPAVLTLGQITKGPFKRKCKAHCLWAVL